ncbi:MAG TPA: tyrosine-type recombinase/integrase [Kineosporiaceae bacterium]|nr:tyrosine-type recombinase/integrase [Kineosporiaceae bacterium]
MNTDGHIGNGWFRTNVWNKTLAEANLGFHVTPHGLRHAHASWLLAGGADLQVVKERLGHGSISTTEKYLHTLPGAHDSALKALDAIRGPGAQSGASEQEVPEAESELAEMRTMMARFKQLYESMGNVV